MEITIPALQTLNDGVSTAYNTAFWDAPTVYGEYSYDASSTGPSEVYPRLDLISGLREWIGARVIERLSLTTFSVVNKHFEKTISIDRDQLEDDKYGFLAPAAQQLGQNAAHLPDLLTTQLLLAGHTTKTYDGQNFFDAAHPTYDLTGKATTVANYQTPNTGDTAGQPWFLMDTTKVLRPLIWQRRRPFAIIPMVALDSEIVFKTREFVWGVDGRCNAGFGLWHLAAMSTAPLTPQYVMALRAQVAAISRPDGTPMGIVPNILVHGPANAAAAIKVTTGEFDTSATSPTIAYEPNPAKGLLRRVENPWIR